MAKLLKDQCLLLNEMGIFLYFYLKNCFSWLMHAYALVSLYTISKFYLWLFTSLRKIGIETLLQKAS